MLPELSRKHRRGSFMAPRPRRRGAAELEPVAVEYPAAGSYAHSDSYDANARAESSQAQPPDTILTLTEPTPPVHSSNLPTIPGSKAPVAGRVPSRQPTVSALSLRPQRSLTGASDISLTTEAGWHLAVNSNVQRDTDFVDEWQHSMDVLLIFATLFGAIITAFLIETFKELRGQNEEIIALLSEISLKLGGGTSVAAASFAAGSGTDTLRRVRRVNRLWIASLAITIGSAIFAMLAKQWISEYVEGLGFDDSHLSKKRLIREARLREFRFAGLRRWYVPEIIGTLPILLHTALLLFGVGLIDFFWNLDRGTSIIILVFVSVIYVLYVISVALPSFFPDSPYRTPLSHLLSNLLRTVPALFKPSMRKDDEQLDPPDLNQFARKRLRHGFTANGALVEAERREVDKEGSELDRQFLLRLKGTTRSDTLADWVDLELKTLDHPLPRGSSLSGRSLGTDEANRRNAGQDAPAPNTSGLGLQFESTSRRES